MPEQLLVAVCRSGVNVGRVKHLVLLTLQSGKHTLSGIQLHFNKNRLDSSHRKIQMFASFKLLINKFDNAVILHYSGCCVSNFKRSGAFVRCAVFRFFLRRRSQRDVIGRPNSMQVVSFDWLVKLNL